MTSCRADTDASRRYRWIPWCFLGGFAVVLVANGTLLYFATRQPVGLVVEKPYERGIAYNKLLAAARDQAKLGWQAEASVRDYSATAERGRLLLTLTDPAGPLAEAVVQVTLSRPVEGDSLPTLTLPVENGSAQAVIQSLRAGQWSARLVVRKGENQAVLEQRLIVK